MKPFNFNNYKGIRYEGCKYTTKEINSNFKMKVKGIDELGNKINKLVGVAGLIALIGVEFVNKFVEKAMKRCFSDPFGKFEVKLRRGLKITFYLF